MQSFHSCLDVDSLIDEHEDGIEPEAVDEPEETPVVAFSHAGAHPWAVMIHYFHTAIAK